MSVSVPIFDAVRVLVAGDLMLDRYWLGSTGRISPEAPVPVVKLDEREDRPGGAANVAVNVAALGARASLEFRTIFHPTINDSSEAEYAAAICARLVGADAVERNPPLIMASEDFSFMLEQVPGCYINIGNGDGEGVCEVHNPGYDFNDESLVLGASFFARLVEDRLAVSGA